MECFDGGSPKHNQLGGLLPFFKCAKNTVRYLAGTAVLVKLQAAAAGHMWGPEEAKQGGESAAKHKAPCASSSKGLWSNR